MNMLRKGFSDSVENNTKHIGKQATVVGIFKGRNLFLIKIKGEKREDLGLKSSQSLSLNIGTQVDIVGAKFGTLLIKRSPKLEEEH